jgi:Tfp pilus assembly protein PilF
MPARYVSANVVVAMMLLAAAGAAGQSTNSGKTTTSTKPPSTRPVTQEERRLVFLTGHVKLDDGTDPSERVAIERVCNGRTRREGYTDSRGAFGFQLGAQQIMQDASVSGMDTLRPAGVPTSSLGGGSGVFAPTTQTSGVSQRELMGCELRAVLPGYTSEPLNLAGRQLFDNPDVGTLVLHRMGKVEGTKISLTTLQAPPEAKKAFERARHALAKKDNPEAERQLQKAVAQYPKYAEAMSLLGEVYSGEGRKDEAEKMFREAMEADPKFIGPYFNLAVLAGTTRDWQRMLELTDKAVALDPYENPAIYLMNAVAQYNLHNLVLAEKSARQARRLDAQYHYPRADFILANILTQRGDYAGAAEQLRSFLQYATADAEADAAREMLAQTQQKIAAGPAPQPK